MSLARRTLLALDSAWFAVDMTARLGFERLTTGIAFNPSDKKLRADPHPYYRQLRERDPVHRTHPASGWVLSRFADCLEVLSDKTFSSDERNLSRWKRFRRRGQLAGIPDPYESGLVSMLRQDAPHHTRLRSLVTQAFTPRAVERMRGRIEQVADELLTPLAHASRLELVGQFAAPLPVVAIAEMLGVPSEDRERFRHWSNEVVRTLGESSFEDNRRAFRARDELCEYFAGIIAERRAEPRDDLITALAAAEEEGDRLSQTDLFGILVLLLVAGNETTTKLIANSVIALLRNPEQLALLQDEPKRIAGAVDELLRYDGPVQLTSRMVCEDRELAGVTLRKGQQLVLLLAAANRDPEQFDDPERLDVTRENVRHLALGHGAHFCLGAQLARLEAGIALEALITRFPDLRFAGDEIQWGDNTILRGPVRLPLAV
ncbi:MAG: cytochrome P450 [Proteobacteria bacterium]|nr:cytochrome P450 [Pseudomonadota bacterium]